MQNELDDLDQMLEATNQRRRRAGEPELTEASLRDQVAEDARRAQRAPRDATSRRRTSARCSTLTNEKRRRRGEPELTEAELRAEVERNT